MVFRERESQKLERKSYKKNWKKEKFTKACLLIGNERNQNQILPEWEWRVIGIKLLNFIPIFTNFEELKIESNLYKVD